MVALNHAVAVAMADGPARRARARRAARAASSPTITCGTPRVPTSSAGSIAAREAAKAYRQALALVGSDPERRFLERRLSEMGT